MKKSYLPTILIKKKWKTKFDPEYYISKNFSEEIIDAKTKKTLVKKGNGDFNAKSKKDGNTALITAAQRNKTELAQMLIDNGADIEIRAKDKNNYRKRLSFIK